MISGDVGDEKFCQRAIRQTVQKLKRLDIVVAPGPIWTPLILASFREEDVAEFGSDVPMGRAGEPEEGATSYVFLTSDDSSYMTGQILHPNGGEIVNS